MSITDPKIEQSHPKKPGIGWMPPVIVISLMLIMGLGYGFYTTRNLLEERITTLEQALDSTNQEIAKTRAASDQQKTEFAAGLQAVTERVGVTASDLQKARQQIATRIKEQQEAHQQVEQQMATEIAAKASSTDVDTLRQEATTKLAEVQQDTNTKFGNVSNEVTVVKTDLATTRQDFGRQLVDVKNTLSDGIARNASELAQLRKKGERDYIELDIRKNSKAPFQRVGDIQLALLKSDVKNKKYNVAIQVDDNRLEKKDRTANEPVQFLVGRDQLRYELVINSVDKDRIRGYLSVPKDRVLSAEGPTFRQQ